MNFTGLLKELNLPSDVTRKLEEYRHLFPAHKELILGMTAHPGAAEAYAQLEKVLGGDDMAMLACQVYGASLIREKYRAMGIGDDVFLDTMGCFRRFLGETLHRTGKLCFDRGWWTYRQLSMRLFRIGQLEYEMLQDPHVISLHIPSDSKITVQEVDASLLAARAFFADHFPDYAEAPIGCESWLLSPALREHLDGESRILAFQNRFFILHADPEPGDVLEWLFSVPEDTAVENLPENTSLQRKVKKYMLSGGKIGVARGVLK